MKRETLSTWPKHGRNLARQAAFAAVALGLAACATTAPHASPQVSTAGLQRDVDDSFIAADSSATHSTNAAHHLDQGQVALSRVDAKMEVIQKYWDTAK